jgi:imidazolonepropionase-like amidohydrolase
MKNFFIPEQDPEEEPPMLLLNNATILTMDQNTRYDTGFVLLCAPEKVESDLSGQTGMQEGRPGRIIAVGQGDGREELAAYCLEKGLESSDCIRIDGRGGVVMPGFIDPHCHLGLWEDGQRDEDGDGNEETDPATPQLRAIDAINPFDPCFREAVAGGITSVMTGPGSANVIGGQFAFIKTSGTNIEKMVVKAPAAMKAAFGENPKSVYGKRNTAPGSRMGTASILRESLFKAKKYREDQQKAASDPAKDSPEWSLKNESMLQVLDGSLPLKIHAHRADDMLTAIRICREFGLRYTLDHCTEGYRIAEHLYEEVQSGRLEGVITGPLLSDRSKPELAHQTIQNPGLLSRRGIPVGIMTDHPVIPLQYLPVTAAIASREGMDEQKALEAITIQAARLCGVEARVGSLKEGKDGDVILLGGHPFEFRTKVLCTIIDGRIVFQAAQ